MIIDFSKASPQFISHMIVLCHGASSLNKQSFFVIVIPWKPLLRVRNLWINTNIVMNIVMKGGRQVLASALKRAGLSVV